MDFETIFAASKTTALMPTNDHDPESEPLLLAVKAKIDELRALLETVSSRWHGEDKFYRFYHQSWKLYGLQTDTMDMVEALQALWPKRHFHPWFAQIIRDGTGLEFSFADNRDWLRKGRPIVEAFFHARTMLEMAVRYGKELEHAPRAMPSGWAVLLELYSGPEPGTEPLPEPEIVPAREERFRL
jgi:hypothetical protein